jgi:hypothetical protein
MQMKAGRRVQWCTHTHTRTPAHARPHLSSLSMLSLILLTLTG